MVDPRTSAQRSAWWVRLLAALPWWVMNPLADAIAWLSWRVVRVEQRPLRENLTASFPTLTEAQLQQRMRDFYRGFAQVLVEVVRSVSLTPGELRRRVVLEGFEPVRAALASGSPVLLVAAHQCNWEWMLLALSLELGYPVEAAYKPLVDGWAQREMLKARSRFGARLVPAQELLPHILRGGRTPRAIAMVADQEPRTSERRHRLLHGGGGNHPRHQIPGVFPRPAAHQPRPLQRVGDTAVRARREARAGGADRALCAAGGGADPGRPHRLAVVA